MAIKDKNGIHGRIGEFVYQVQKGQQTKRAMPKRYNDKMSDEQLSQRYKMKAVQELYRKLKPAVKGCFEHSREGQRDCDSFMSLNLLKMNTVSGGSLPLLNYRMVDDRVECDIIAEDWKKKDILRFISLTEEGISFEDIVIEAPESTTIVREAKVGGQYAFVHLRDSRKGRLVSSQRLVPE